ncbi:Regulator of nonsense transcripts UPF3 [Smittium mucronatum]|uniref:Regulator of nonsense transcripts UPF3 n=1 Tax=Smittium mucronatum TaxID=133383 RepID=A0A1R0GSQ3_9FUNG|nr:Regulator of nonsense transcripts UPF3 [Smittium mucronatum]
MENSQVTKNGLTQTLDSVPLQNIAILDKATQKGEAVLPQRLRNRKKKAPILEKMSSSISLAISNNSDAADSFNPSIDSTNFIKQSPAKTKISTLNPNSPSFNMRTPAEKTEAPIKPTKTKNRIRTKKYEAKEKTKSSETISKESPTAKNHSREVRTVRSNKNSKNSISKSQSKAKNDGDTKNCDNSNSTTPNLKLVIRNLPADLPEHIFWMSIEKFLKWYQPTKAGSIVKMSKKVQNLPSNNLENSDEENSVPLDPIALSIPEPITQGTNGPPSNILPQQDAINKTEKPSKEDQNSSSTQKTGSSSNESSTKKELNDKTTDIQTYMSPFSIEELPVYRSPNLEILDRYPYWRSFVSGKLSKRESKLSVPSRAYIKFKNMEELAYFSISYNGHKFVSRSGIEHTATVEPAPYQASPNKTPYRKDNLSGTIFNDKDFLEFFNSRKDSQNNLKDVIPDAPTSNIISLQISGDIDNSLISPKVPSIQKSISTDNTFVIKSTFKSIVGDDIFQPLDDSKKEKESTAILDYLRSLKSKKSFKSISKAEKRPSSNKQSRNGKGSVKAKKKLVDQGTKNWTSEPGKVIKIASNSATGNLVDTTIQDNSNKSFGSNQSASKLQLNDPNSVRKDILGSIKIASTGSNSSPTTPPSKSRAPRNPKKSLGSASKHGHGKTDTKDDNKRSGHGSGKPQKILSKPRNSWNETSIN